VSEAKVLCSACNCFHYFNEACHVPYRQEPRNSSVVHRDFHKQVVAKLEKEISSIKAHAKISDEGYRRLMLANKRMHEALKKIGELADRRASDGSRMYMMGTSEVREIIRSTIEN
jgi:3-deoxy-D-manno-octulosonic-acid transferase